MSFVGYIDDDCIYKITGKELKKLLMAESRDDNSYTFQEKSIIARNRYVKIGPYEIPPETLTTIKYIVRDEFCKNCKFKKEANND